MSNPLIPPVATEVSLLEKGMRAARRGQRRQAHQLLSSAVAAEPTNEEAWLWLARVEEEPQARAEQLRRILTLNPNNQWAQGQLAALNTPTAKQTPPATRPSPPATQEQIQLQVLSCPNCGSSVTPRSAETQTLVCRHCQRILELTAEQAQIIGNASGRAKPSQPIHLGDRAKFDGREYEVIGWLRYEGRDDEDTWRWDEWLLLSTQGELRWLSHDNEHGFVMQTKTNFTEPFDVNNDSSIPTPDGTARITESEQAKLIALAGELTWRATLGDTIRYLEASIGRSRYNKIHYSVELIAQQEIELFRGVELAPRQVWAAFNNTAMLEQLDSAAHWRPVYRWLAALALLLALICAGGMVVSFAERPIFTGEARLVQGAVNSQRVGPIPLTKIGRANQLRLHQITSLTGNNAAEVEVTLIDRTEEELPLFAYEFWHETGVDGDGPWTEGAGDGLHLFKLTEDKGPYYLEVTLDQTTVHEFAVQIAIVEGVWLARYWGMGMMVFLVCALVFYLLSNREA